MNILFSAFINPKRKSGVDKKIYGQIKAFEKLGHNVWYFTFSDGKMFLCNKGEKTVLSENVSSSPIGYYMAIEDGVRRTAAEHPIDAVYIRRIFCTPFHLKTLKMLKSKGVLTIEELPTYPYDKENKDYTNPAYRIAALVDRLCRGGFKRCLDRFVTFSADKTIFGVPCINIDNGIDMDNIVFEDTVFPKDRIDMISVSVMAPWHGYERIIEGLNHYYKSNPSIPVYFHVVGDGAEKENWQKLTQSYGLDDYITFYGHKTGAELNEIYRRCQIGIASLGFYKIGLDNGSPLKIREYTAMGKPFIYACGEQKLDDSSHFCLRFPNDDTPVDINRVVSFYSEVSSIDNISSVMNQFAKDNYSWDIQIKKVMDALPL